MRTLFQYIFCKAYYFCIRVFKEKEFPWAWAAMATSFILVVTITNLLGLIEVLILPKRINTYVEYHKYFSLGMVILAPIYVKRNNRYMRILEVCKQIPESKRLMLRYVSIVYILILVVGFFWLGEIIRDFNLSHQVFVHYFIR